MVSGWLAMAAGVRQYESVILPATRGLKSFVAAAAEADFSTFIGQVDEIGTSLRRAFFDSDATGGLPDTARMIGGAFAEAFEAAAEATKQKRSKGGGGGKRQEAERLRQEQIRRELELEVARLEELAQLAGEEDVLQQASTCRPAPSRSRSSRPPTPIGRRRPRHSSAWSTWKRSGMACGCSRRTT